MNCHTVYNKIKYPYLKWQWHHIVYNFFHELNPPRLLSNSLKEFCKLFCLARIFEFWDCIFRLCFESELWYTSRSPNIFFLQASLLNVWKKMLPLVGVVNRRFLLLVCSPFNEDFYLGKCPHCVSREFFISRNPVNHGPLDAYPDYPRDTPSFKMHLQLYSEFDSFLIFLYCILK